MSATMIKNEIEEFLNGGLVSWVSDFAVVLYSDCFNS